MGVMLGAVISPAGADGAAHAGVVVDALLAGAALVVSSRATRARLMLAALGVAPLLVVVSIANTSLFGHLQRHAVLSILAIVGLIAVVDGLQHLFMKRPTLLPLAALAALPFRVPIPTGTSSTYLLIPLYLVISAGVLTRARRPWNESSPATRVRPRALECALAASLVLYALQASWSPDFAKALQQITFFYVPFALLFLLLRDTEWSPWLLRRSLALLLTLAVLFVAVGCVEYARHQVLLNPKVIAGNGINDYFEVNSLFFDPNIYGRFLVLVILGAATALLAEVGRTRVLGMAALVAFLWTGLFLSLSRSSFVALLAGLTMLGALRWDGRRVAIAAAAAATVAAGLVALAPGAVGLQIRSSRDADQATSGRFALIRGGLALFASAPMVGHGSGSFSTEYRLSQTSPGRSSVSASHTIPITVAAEQGIIGLGTYLALLVIALERLIRAARGSPAAAFLAAAFLALVVHTFLYADFLEDPATWALLAAGAATSPVARRPRRERVRLLPRFRIRSAASPV